MKFWVPIFLINLNYKINVSHNNDNKKKKNNISMLGKQLTW